jgi:hypothetical protein
MRLAGTPEWEFVRSQATAVGGLWLWNTRFPSGLVMVVVPSAFKVIVQPQRCTQDISRSRSHLLAHRIVGVAS